MVTLKSQHCPLLFTQPDILPPPTPGTLTPKKPPLWPPLLPPPSTTDQQCPQSPSRRSREASPDDCPKALRSMTLQKSQPHCTPLTRLLTPNPPTRPRVRRSRQLFPRQTRNWADSGPGPAAESPALAPPPEPPGDSRPDTAKETPGAPDPGARSSRQVRAGLTFVLQVHQDQ